MVKGTGMVSVRGMVRASVIVEVWAPDSPQEALALTLTLTLIT